jgi:diaminohydroxyphosphoribosylaminopyrimidine deaminase/5-amino-6-(5-phosphoribosylamino)uracil reductase
VLALCCAPSPSRRRELERAGVAVAVVRADGGRVSLPAALEVLAARGVTSLMVEGGGEVLGSFLAARLLDQVALFRAPLLLGGRGSRPAFGGPDPLRIRDALRLEPVPDDPAFPWPFSPQFELWRPRR